jgi:hypothetical protein
VSTYPKFYICLSPFDVVIAIVVSAENFFDFVERYLLDKSSDRTWGLVVNAPVSYSGGSGFKSRSGGRLS